ncbi:MAG: hypothetical protein LQ350_006131 [Teloschistes chrysophthalmus]|nr:MAG: hypothetical protein LQ350_006131 [Niorma chrysophthalma]
MWNLCRDLPHHVKMRFINWHVKSVVQSMSIVEDMVPMANSTKFDHTTPAADFHIIPPEKQKELCSSESNLLYPQGVRAVPHSARWPTLAKGKAKERAVSSSSEDSLRFRFGETYTKRHGNTRDNPIVVEEIDPSQEAQNRYPVRYQSKQADPSTPSHASEPTGGFAALDPKPAALALNPKSDHHREPDTDSRSGGFCNVRRSFECYTKVEGENDAWHEQAHQDEMENQISSEGSTHNTMPSPGYIYIVTETTAQLHAILTTKVEELKTSTSDSKTTSIGHNRPTTVTPSFRLP